MASIATQTLPKTGSVAGAPALDAEARKIDERAAKKLGFVNPAPKALAPKRPLAAVLRTLLWSYVLNEVSVRRYKDAVVAAAAKKADAAKAVVEKLLLRREFCDAWRSGGLLGTCNNRMIERSFNMINISCMFAVICGAASTAVAVWGFGITESALPFFAGLLAGYAAYRFGSLLYLRYRYKELLNDTVEGETARNDEMRELCESNPYLGWNRVRLESYNSGRIPTSVLEAALEIAEICPQADFWVHHTYVTRLLTQEEVSAEMQARYIDPFLEVQLGNESYFIAVWDEQDCRVTKQALQ